MSNTVNTDLIFEALKNPPLPHSKANAGATVFPSKKQPMDIFNHYISNEISIAEHNLTSTFSIDNRDMTKIKMGNALTLYESNYNIQLFVMWSFYLLRCKALKPEMDSLPIELLVLQKLGYYTSLEWLDQPVYLPEESKFIKHYPYTTITFYG